MMFSGMWWCNYCDVFWCHDICCLIMFHFGSQWSTRFCVFNDLSWYMKWCILNMKATLIRYGIEHINLPWWVAPSGVQNDNKSLSQKGTTEFQGVPTPGPRTSPAATAVSRSVNWKWLGPQAMLCKSMDALADFGPQKNGSLGRPSTGLWTGL
jgi:hypothetical protein